MGTEGVIRCPNASLGNPQVDIYWQKEPGNTHLREGNEIAFRDGRRELVIHDVTASHAGRYICILGNAECQSTPAYPANRSITVSVQGLGKCNICSRVLLATTAAVEMVMLETGN